MPLCIFVTNNSKYLILTDPCIVDYSVDIPTRCSFVMTYLLTYLLTPWSRVLLEKLTSKLCS